MIKHQQRMKYTLLEVIAGELVWSLAYCGLEALQSPVPVCSGYREDTPAI
jgi:hypothetical protein